MYMTTSSVFAGLPGEACWVKVMDLEICLLSLYCLKSKYSESVTCLSQCHASRIWMGLGVKVMDLECHSLSARMNGYACKFEVSFKEWKFLQPYCTQNMMIFQSFR